MSLQHNSGFLQVRENWKKSVNLTGQGKVREMENWCHQMSDFQAIIHQFRFQLGLRPRPRWGAYSTPPDSLAALNIAP